MKNNETQNCELIDLAMDSEEYGGYNAFPYFLIGWLKSNNHEEMATAARCYMETHHAKDIAAFDLEQSEKISEKPLELSAE